MEEGMFNLESLIKMSGSIMPVDALKNIESYNDEMTISQVVRFFERQGINFTKTMIQNYVRVGLIPPPVDKRYYIKEHLILLTIIDSLKDIYSLEEIGGIFRAIMNDINTFEDDVIDMTIVYNKYIELFQKYVIQWQEKLPEIVKTAYETAESTTDNEADKQRVIYFITVLSLMTQSIATKQLVRLMMGVASDLAKAQEHKLED